MDKNFIFRGIALCTLVGVLGAGGCIDSRGKFDEFSSRLPDAAPDSNVDAPVLAEIPDITGTFLAGIYVYSLQATPYQFRMVNTMTRNGDGTAALDTTISPLSWDTRVPVPTPFSTSAVPIDHTGQFTLTFTNVSVDRAADPNGLNSDIMISPFVWSGIARSVDLFCGAINGTVTNFGANLDGSTFAAKRVAADATGAALGDVLFECPPESRDAGVD